MRLVALTGGIGSGKSSVSSRLVDRGAVIVDADLIARQLQEPGRPVYEAMVERWGPSIVGDDGQLKRQAVADIVFRDADELKALNRMIHPAVVREMNRQREAADSGRLVVMDIPLFAESPVNQKRAYTAVIVVDTPPEVSVARLVAHRGFDEVDAWNRIANQASREDRLALADFVIDNSGTPEELDAEIERLMTWLAARPDVEPPTDPPPRKPRPEA